MIKAVTVTADGTAISTPARVKKIYYILGGSAGSIELKDGGASGESKLTLNTPATATGEASGSLSIPDEGMRFETDVYVDVTNVTHLTIFHG